MHSSARFDHPLQTSPSSAAGTLRPGVSWPLPCVPSFPHSSGELAADPGAAEAGSQWLAVVRERGREGERGREEERERYIFSIIFSRYYKPFLVVSPSLSVLHCRAQL